MGFRLCGLWFVVRGLWFVVSGFGSRFSGFRLRVSGLGVRGFEFWVQVEGGLSFEFRAFLKCGKRLRLRGRSTMKNSFQLV